jgi:protein-tyrosine phosphatase
MKKILFVCTDNLTRSVIAEFCLKEFIKNNNLHDIHVASAGLRAHSDISKFSTVHFDRMKELDIDTSEHERTPFSNEHFHNFDYIVCMDTKHHAYILEHYDQEVLLFNDVLKGEKSSIIVPPPDPKGLYKEKIKRLVDDMLAMMPTFVKNLLSQPALHQKKI